MYLSLTTRSRYTRRYYRILSWKASLDRNGMCLLHLFHVFEFLLTENYFKKEIDSYLCKSEFLTNEPIYVQHLVLGVVVWCVEDLNSKDYRVMMQSQMSWAMQCSIIMMKVQTTELPGNEIGSKHILHLRKKYYTIPNFVRTGIDSTISNSHPNIILSLTSALIP